MGLEVKMLINLPETVAYLGEGSVRVFDTETHLYRNPTPEESADFLTEKLASKQFWIPRIALLDATGPHDAVTRPNVWLWLKTSMFGREYFCVPEEMVEVF